MNRKKGKVGKDGRSGRETKSPGSMHAYTCEPFSPTHFMQLAGTPPKKKNSVYGANQGHNPHARSPGKRRNWGKCGEKPDAWILPFEVQREVVQQREEGQSPWPGPDGNSGK